MNLETRLFWASLDCLTLPRLKLMRRYFGDLEMARKHCHEAELKSAGIAQRGRESIVRKLEGLDMEKTQRRFESSGAQLLFFEDESFPESLRNIPDPPIFLFVSGSLVPEDTVSLSVVGTRNASAHGKQAVSALMPELVSAGFTIISGMARGIDTAAHREALKHSGRTLAVWGTGIDRVYPSENSRLAQEIRERGAIISEFPLGTEPSTYNFPRRNRIVSGLSLGTLVVEGKEKSGSLITAMLALEQGKEVFAVPGSPFAPNCAGPNRLIQRGEAKLVQNANDIVSEFSFLTKTTHPRKFVPENELEKIIASILTREAMSFDELVLKSGKPGYELSAALTMMAMKGIVQDLGMNQWVRNF